MKNYLRVGVITKTHGIRGEVKVYPTTEDHKRFEELDEVLLDIGEELISLEIEGVKYFKETVILKFKGINNINDVEKYKGKDLLILRDQAIPLEDDEYFIHDLLGFEIITEDNSRLGALKEIMVTKANDVFVVETDDKKEILIPSIKECILDVDTKNKKIRVHILDGLL